MGINNIFKLSSILVSGSLLAQIINFLGTLLSVRLFTVNDFGLYTYFITISSLFLPIINFRLDMAIVTEKNEKSTFVIVKICLYLCLVLAFIISIIYYIYWNGNSEIKITFWPFLFVNILINGYINIVTAWNTKCGEYVLISKANIKRALFLFVFVIIFSVLLPNVYGLITALILSNLFAIKEQSKDLINKLSFVFDVSKYEIKKILWNYKSFIFYSVPAAFINNFSYVAVNFLIEDLYGIDQLAYYALSFRILGMPLNLISSNISKVFFEQSSKEFHKIGSFRNALNRTLKVLVIFSILIGLLIYLYCDWFFETFFSQEWYVSAEYIKILLLMFMVRFIVSPLTICVMINKNNIIELIGQILFLINFLVIYYLSYFFQLKIYDFLKIYSFTNIIIYVVWIVYIFSLAGDGNVNSNKKLY